MRSLRRVIGAAAVPLLVVAGGATFTGIASALPDTGSVVAPAGADTEVTFDASGTTFHGSLRTPEGDIKGAALLLPGSGVTDRNGNQAPLMVADTLLRVADSLAAHGIASLRFDKIGAGATGLGSYAPETGKVYGFTDQVDHAQAAAELLSERTGFAADDILVLGHSEGGLTTLALAQRGVGDGYGLLAPLSMRYLDLLNGQLEAVANSGQLDEAAAEQLRNDLPRTIESLRTSGTVPDGLSPIMEQFGFNDYNATFLAEADALNPPDLAASLPSGVPVLLTCSDKDLNISCDQIAPLRASLEHTNLQFDHFTTANHTLEELGPLPAGVADGPVLLPASTEFATAINGWAAQRGA
ncbi:alpha/beta hydrolase [Rhodococcus sp. F64268]|uniref:alpha/beta hydrolase n=1 Tax=Rhodococcus sp. F64268 TaxID=2926402 RepID=UPI001FF5BD07|nr:alpha/beta fold hydrolase [Rhodococcus sp. F64268]MCK0093000.1 alpha/beta hydrolase [Rhodococcus sp. F64268]